MTLRAHQVWRRRSLTASVIGAALLAACTTGPGVVRMKSATEMFGAAASVNWQDAEPDAVRRTLLAAPFADVQRAAMVAASQAQFNIEQEDKRGGVLLATRDVRGEWNPGNHNSVTNIRYSYLIVVREAGPRSTEVRIGAKVQADCTPYSGIGRTVFAVTTLGISEATGMGEGNARCQRMADGTWAKGQGGSQQEMGQFMNFLRNNLIAAGAL